MSAPDFRGSLEAQVVSILQDYVGQGGQYSDPVNYVQTWNNHFTDFDINSDVPFVITTVRQTQQLGRPSGEMGTSRELWNWMVDIYYFDVEQTDYDTGYARQGDIVNRMRNALENEPRLRGLSVAVNPTSPTGAFNEYVYNNDWQSVTWDVSGQDGYFGFASEMHLLVQTARN